MENQQIKRNYQKKDGPVVIHELKRKDGYIQKVSYVKKKYCSEDMKRDIWGDYKGKMKKKDICEKYKISLPTLNKYLKICEALFSIKKFEEEIEKVNITVNLNEDDKKEDREFNKIELDVSN